MCALLALLAGCGEREAEQAVAATFSDPSAARFQSIVRRGDFVCGEVSPGGSSRYSRFIYEDGPRHATVEPGKSYSEFDLAGFATTCRMLGSAGTAFDREACTRAADARRNSERAKAFVESWDKQCRD